MEGRCDERERFQGLSTSILFGFLAETVDTMVEDSGGIGGSRNEYLSFIRVVCSAVRKYGGGESGAQKMVNMNRGN